MNLILTGIVLAVPAYMAFCVIHGYATATGTTWERLKAAFKGSLSIFWARINALSLSAIAGWGAVAPYVGATGIQEQIEKFLSPWAMLAYMLFVLIGAEIARQRTL